jgi:hypothetical protein
MKRLHSNLKSIFFYSDGEFDDEAIYEKLPERLLMLPGSNHISVIIFLFWPQAGKFQRCCPKF